MFFRKILYFVLLILFVSCFRNHEPQEFSETLEVNSEASENLVKNKQSFDIDTNTYQIYLSLNKDLYKYFQNEPKNFQYQGKLPDNWQEEFYNIFLNNERDEVFLNSLIDELNYLNVNENEDDLVEILIAYVQGALEYDWNSFYDINKSVKYPYETLVKSKGVCSDKSILLAKLLNLLNYDIVLFVFEKANHMAVGIKVPSKRYGNFGTDYAFIETTNYAQIGQIPENYAGGIKIRENPKIIHLKQNASRVFYKIQNIKEKEKEIISKYGKDYLFANAYKKRLIIQMKTLEKKLNDLKREQKKSGCEGTVSEDKYEYCKELVERINKLVSEYNKKVNEYNREKV